MGFEIATKLVRKTAHITTILRVSIPLKDFAANVQAISPAQTFSIGSPGTPLFIRFGFSFEYKIQVLDHCLSRLNYQPLDNLRTRVIEAVWESVKV